MAGKTTVKYANGSAEVAVRYDASSTRVTGAFYNGVELEPI